MGAIFDVYVFATLDGRTIGDYMMVDIAQEGIKVAPSYRDHIYAAAESCAADSVHPDLEPLMLPPIVLTRAFDSYLGTGNWPGTKVENRTGLKLANSLRAYAQEAHVQFQATSRLIFV